MPSTENGITIGGRGWVIPAVSIIACAFFLGSTYVEIRNLTESVNRLVTRFDSDHDRISVLESEVRALGRTRTQETLK